MGLGLGIDLHWDLTGSGTGELRVSPSGKPCLKPGLPEFLKNYGNQFEDSFFSLQPRSTDLLINPAALDPVIEAFQHFQSHLPHIGNWGLHHTFLNMGTLEQDYPREKIAALTNRLIHALNLKWVNEDLGIWSLFGKNLAYPVPPILSKEGLAASCENILFYKNALDAQLRVEFPGFSEGHSVILGNDCAFEFFKECIERTDAACVLDTGHILSYQWLQGHRGAELFRGLEKSLPLEHCVEIHVSGCSIMGDRFFDFHHGIILDEQLELLDLLLKTCPHVKTVTYEDPKYLPNGLLIPKSVAGFQKLKERVALWSKQARVA